jgi:uncharacterized membrane protein YdjX (TVP38/TMEM64 family)
MKEKASHQTPPGRGGGLLKTVLVAAVVLGLLAAGRHFDIPGLFRDALAWIDSAGPAGPLAFFVLYVAACVLMLPGSILTLGAGAVFGVLNGVLLVSLSSTAGATAAFLAGRYLARRTIARRMSGNRTFNALNEAVAAEGWKIVGLARLSPVLPFNLLNYALGLTRVSLRDYVVASWIGMIPGTVMYVYLGSLAGSLAELGAGRARSATEWALFLAGLAATVAMALVLTRIARRALQRRIDGPPEAKETP